MAEDPQSDPGLSRRQLLVALSGAGPATLAGCNQGQTTTEPPATATATDTATPTATATPTPTPADPRLESLSLSTTTLGQFQPATLTATMTNAGGSAFVGTLGADVGHDTFEREGVELAPGETVTLETDFTEGVIGEHELAFEVVSDASGEAVVEATRAFEVVRYPEHFVGVDGTEFTCGDGTLYLNGANDQQVVASQIPESRIEAVFTIAEDLGMNVMRVFGVSPAWGEQAAQPAPGEYSEAFFERFDRIIASAKRHDLRLVVPLVTNAPGPDSIPQYVEWVDGATEYNDFYENERCRELYRDYVEHVLTRENPLTGLEYREDPTIMMWELGNELNCKWPKKYPLDWIREMGGHVKDLDGNHLLSTGFRGNQWGDDPNDKDSYKDGIDPETTIIRDHEPEVIDAASLHFYPRTYDFDGEALLPDFINSVHEMLDKPIYIGEFNWDVDLGARESLSTRDEKLSSWFAIAREEGLNAAMVHEISTPAIDAIKEGSRGDYTIIPKQDDRTAEILRGHSEWARSTSTTSCPDGITQ